MIEYEYECVVCKHTWQVDQRITDLPVASCYACGSPDGARRLIGASGGFRLLGRGWAADGYAGKR